MALDGLLSGISHKLNFVEANGNIISFALKESFQAKEDATIGKEIFMDGTVRHPKFCQGWSGSFVLAETSDIVDRYFSNFELNYLNGGNQLDIIIDEYKTYEDGTTTHYQYKDCVLTLTDGGTFSGTAIAKQTISFNASTKQPAAT